ncbi:Gliding motility protein [Flavobacterium sp. 9AF]|uniref:type IX secretion system periplasmic lipoprotein PorW/SprE n=1 Tax=Flavobacterium sp. 9AF TaxID=2653142 RepID=UPI0012F201DF|nr:gliding motility protein [Flavobacterium sp. 9AF]VXB33427.1 Gliding motility protein [Flavobacterium sp. 9AF]
MKKNILKYTLIIGFLFFLIACSVKKDKFINRNFHAVTTEYNILYNGNLALDAGKAELVTTYKDNFWEILPIERMPVQEEDMMPGDKKNPNFERAEEKAVKAIQKHSMNIKGKEKNPQMDEAYLLLGKARYYDNRFLPSLEAFNYILYKYPTSDKIYHAKVWREKVNIRLENEETAIKNLKKLLEEEKIDGQDIADANAMLTEAYMNIGAKDSAIATIKIAKSETKNKEEKARYSFILGQLYESMEYNDSAYTAFQEVIDMNRKAPRRYVIQAHAKQAMQFDYKNGDTLLFTEKFNKLIEDRENRPFLDVLYHQMGIFYDKQEIDSTAKKWYNKSLRAVTQDRYLAASNYRNIGEIYFKKAEYKTAGQYYDSTLIQMDNRTKEYRKIKKKRDNLEDVIKYETIAHDNDSILSLVHMGELERKKFFEEHIKKIKIADSIQAKIESEKAEKEAIKQENLAKTKIQNSLPNNFSNLPPGNLPPSAIDEQQSTFYFYNPVTVAYGKKDFQNKWGNRKLKDNWKLSEAKNSTSFIDDEDNQDNENIAKKDSINAINAKPEYDVSFYLSKLPTRKTEIDTLVKDRNYAYYQLGLIYKEKFKEYELAAKRLEQLLKNNPEERLVLPAKYNLFKIYEILDRNKAEIYKNQIITEYPDSRYAQILLNPSLNVDDDESRPEVVFNKLYKRYAQNELREVYIEVQEKMDQYVGEESLPKFEMLKANVVGRLKGVEEYKKILNYVALTYPNTEEGKEAEGLLSKHIPSLEAMDFATSETSTWKLVFPKKFPEETESKQKLFDKLKKYLEDRRNDDLKLSNDIYTLEEDFVVIHGFITEEVARATLSVLQEYKEYKIKDNVYIISSDDYKIIQIKKKLQEWIK